MILAQLLEIQPFSQWFNQPYLYNKIPIKVLGTEVQLNFPGWQYSVLSHIDMPREWQVLMPRGKNDKNFVLKILFCPRSMVFIWLVLICILLLYKTVIVITAVLWILWIVLANCQFWGVSANLQICSQLVRSGSALGTLTLWLISEVRPALWRDCTFKLKFGPTLGCWFQKSLRRKKGQ